MNFDSSDPRPARYCQQILLKAAGAPSGLSRLSAAWVLAVSLVVGFGSLAGCKPKDSGAIRTADIAALQTVPDGIVASLTLPQGTDLELVANRLGKIGVPGAQMSVIAANSMTAFIDQFITDASSTVELFGFPLQAHLVGEPSSASDIPLILAVRAKPSQKISANKEGYGVRQYKNFALVGPEDKLERFGNFARAFAGAAFSPVSETRQSPSLRIYPQGVKSVFAEEIDKGLAEIESAMASPKLEEAPPKAALSTPDAKKILNFYRAFGAATVEQTHWIEMRIADPRAPLIEFVIRPKAGTVTDEVAAGMHPYDFRMGSKAESFAEPPSIYYEGDLPFDLFFEPMITAAQDMGLYDDISFLDAFKSVTDLLAGPFVGVLTMPTIEAGTIPAMKSWYAAKTKVPSESAILDMWKKMSEKPSNMMGTEISWSVKENTATLAGRPVHEVRSMSTIPAGNLAKGENHVIFKQTIRSVSLPSWWLLSQSTGDEALFSLELAANSLQGVAPTNRLPQNFLAVLDTAKEQKQSTVMIMNVKQLLPQPPANISLATITFGTKVESEIPGSDSSGSRNITLGMDVVAGPTEQ